MRISGTMASLAGLEQAIEENDEVKKDLAIRRMILLHGITLSIGGIPLLYLGEEWGMLNDYEFIKDPAKAGDSRWIHRPKMKWEYLEELNVCLESGECSISTRIYQSMKQLIRLRKSLPALAGQKMKLFDTENEHVLGYVRMNNSDRMIIVGNFSEDKQTIEGNILRTAGLGRFYQDMISEKTYPTSDPIVLGPYQNLWLKSV